jgi:XTP/dITP diphosphohydrolase
MEEKINEIQNINVGIPTADNPDDLAQQFMAFNEIVKLLRMYCPWDRKQTNQSIAYLLIEETYELLDAIENSDDKEFSKELGDILLHVVMHAIMAEERGAFNMVDVLKKIQQKMIYRHPHVFGDVQVNGTGDVLANWEALKMKEGQKSILQGVPKALPALLRAQRIQHKVSNVGFDWDNRADVWNKVEEELHELRAEINAGNLANAEIELGDFFFSLVNAARFEGIVAEEALQKTNNKFTNRFQYIEQRAVELGKSLKDMTLAEMDVLWDEAKKH